LLPPKTCNTVGSPKQPNKKTKVGFGEMRLWHSIILVAYLYLFIYLSINLLPYRFIYWSIDFARTNPIEKIETRERCPMI